MLTRDKRITYLMPSTYDGFHASVDPSRYVKWTYDYGQVRLQASLTCRTGTEYNPMLLAGWF